MTFFDRELHGKHHDKGGAVYNIRHTDIGAAGDGSTNDRGAFATLDADGRQFVVPGATATGSTRTYSIGSDLTLAGNYHINPGAELKVTGTAVLTLNGEVSAGRYQIFATTGTVTINQVDRTAEWFGATSPVLTATTGDETPSVAKARILKGAATATTAIRAFDDGVEGMDLMFVAGTDNYQVKFATATSLHGNGGANWSPSTNDHMTCWRIGNAWHCDISDNTT